MSAASVASEKYASMVIMLKRHVLLRLCRSRELLQASLDTALAIQEVARRAGISEHHFIRQFAALFGVTPHQYRLQARLEQAKRLLAAGEHSVTQVCMAVGFSSLGSFSDLFARRVGVAPSGYRRQLRTLCSLDGHLDGPLDRSLDRPLDRRWLPLLAPSCFSLMAGAAGIAIFEKHARVLADRLPHTNSGFITAVQS